MDGNSSTPALRFEGFAGGFTPNPWSFEEDPLEGRSSFPCPPEIRLRSDGREEEDDAVPEEEIREERDLVEDEDED